MLVLERGLVKFFELHHNKKYGFLKILGEDGQETGEEIFFHFGDGQFVQIVGDEITWAGRDLHHGGKITPMWYPRGNITEVVFQRSLGKDGRDKACPWTYAEEYDNRLRELAAPRYRILKSTSYGTNDSRNTIYPVRAGLRDDELSAEFPIRVLDGVILDLLAPSVDSDAGCTTRYFFEVWIDEHFADNAYGGSTLIPGYWLPCGDPRYVPEEARILRDAQAARQQ